MSTNPVYGGYSGIVQNPQGQAVPNATVTVLSGTIGGSQTVYTGSQPGSPLAVIYADPYGSVQIDQTVSHLVSDGSGNFGFWANSGWYVLQIYGPGVEGQFVQQVSISAPVPVTLLPDSIFLHGAGKQTHYVITFTASSTIYIGGMPGPYPKTSPESVNDTFAPTDAGKTIRIIIYSTEQGGVLQDYETTITSVISPTEATVALAPTIGSTDGEAYWFSSTQDDTAAIQAAINSGIGTIQLDKGVFVIGSPIVNVRNTSKIVGAGSWRTTILQRTSNIQDSFDFTDVMALDLEGFSVVGPGQSASNGGTMAFSYSDFANTERLYVRDVYLRHLGYDGFIINTPILSTMLNCKVLYSAGHGFHIIGGTTTDLINCYAITLVGAGFLIEDGASMIGIQGGASETSGASIIVRGSSSVTIDHCDTEFMLDRTPVTPSAAPVLSVESGGSVPTGSYYAKFCWMHGVCYGQASSESNEAILTSGNQTLAMVLGTVPTNVFRARVYITPANGGSGSEGWTGDITVIPGSEASVLFSSPFTPTYTPPDFFYQGHGIVVSGSSQVSINNPHTNSLPDSVSRSVLVCDGSDEVGIYRPNIVQGTNTPGYDIQVNSGCSNTEIVSAISSGRVLDNGTNTLIRNP